MRIFVYVLIFCSSCHTSIAQSKTELIYDYVYNVYFSNIISVGNCCVLKHNVPSYLSLDISQNKLKIPGDISSNNDIVSIFDSINKQKCKIPIVNHDLKYLSNKKFEKIIGTIYSQESYSFSDPKLSWESYSQKRNTCQGVIYLSRPAISKNNKFIIHAAYFDGTTNGFGRLLCGEINDNLVVVLEELDYISLNHEVIIVPTDEEIKN